jgi:hypothetical protein
MCAQPNSWPEHVLHRNVLELMKSMYSTLPVQGACNWHMLISTLMEEHGYITINSEKECIMHWLLVDDMIHATTSENLHDKFIQVSEYQKDFEITSEDSDAMSSFPGMEIKHNKQDLTIHLDTYIQEMLADYKAAVTKFRRKCRCSWKSCWNWRIAQRALTL